MYTIYLVSISDHVCLQFGFKCYCQFSYVNKLTYCLHSADFAKMHQSINSNVDWEKFLIRLISVKLGIIFHYF